MNRKIKKTTGQINFSAVTITQLVLTTFSVEMNLMYILVQVLPLWSFIYSISCLVQ